MQRNGFVLEKSGRLQSVASENLYQRIRYDRKVSAVTGFAVYAMARAIRPAISLLPSDIQYFAFRRGR